MLCFSPVCNYSFLNPELKHQLGNDDFRVISRLLCLIIQFRQIITCIYYRVFVLFGVF